MSDFETWAILELMGHRRLAGFVTEQEIGGANLLRIDVPSGCDSGLTARHCARCGDCKCPGEDRLDNEECPLHGPTDHPAPPTTQFYSAAAVYCITPTTEEIARGVALRNVPRPVHAFELTPSRDNEPDYFGDDDDDG